MGRIMYAPSVLSKIGCAKALQEKLQEGAEGRSSPHGQACSRACGPKKRKRCNARNRPTDFERATTLYQMQLPVREEPANCCRVTVVEGGGEGGAGREPTMDGRAAESGL